MKKVLGTFLYAWNYIKDSWEGEDGKLSYRRISQYIFLVCMIKSGFWPPHNQWEFYVFIVFAALYLSVVLVLSAEQIIALLKFTLPLAFGKQPAPDPEPEPEIQSAPDVNVIVNSKT